jgi:hypothetical protein
MFLFFIFSNTPREGHLHDPKRPFFFPRPQTPPSQLTASLWRCVQRAREGRYRRYTAYDYAGMTLRSLSLSLYLLYIILYYTHTPNCTTHIIIMSIHPFMNTTRRRRSFLFLSTPPCKLVVRSCKWSQYYHYYYVIMHTIYYYYYTLRLRV